MNDISLLSILAALSLIARERANMAQFLKPSLVIRAGGEALTS